MLAWSGCGGWKASGSRDVAMHGHLIEHLSVPGWKAGYVQTMFTLRGKVRQWSQGQGVQEAFSLWFGSFACEKKKKTTKTEGGQSSTGLERNRALWREIFVFLLSWVQSRLQLSLIWNMVKWKKPTASPQTKTDIIGRERSALEEMNVCSHTLFLSAFHYALLADNESQFGAEIWLRTLSCLWLTQPQDGWSIWERNTKHRKKPGQGVLRLQMVWNYSNVIAKSHFVAISF